MNSSSTILIDYLEGDGVFVDCLDLNQADALEDFLTEVLEIDFRIVFEPNLVRFYFDRNTSLPVVEKIILQFIENCDQ